VIVNFSGITWHTDPDTTAVSPEYDMYSVILHEAIHALGFASLIGPSGNSMSPVPGTNFYSRYDKFLRINGGNFLILNQDSCYDVIFNTTPVIIPAGIIKVIIYENERDINS